MFEVLKIPENNTSSKKFSFSDFIWIFTDSQIHGVCLLVMYQIIYLRLVCPSPHPHELQSPSSTPFHPHPSEDIFFVI